MNAKKDTSVWECECGVMFYGKLPPDECKKCWADNSFIEIDESALESAEEEYLMDKIRAKDLEEEL